MRILLESSRQLRNGKVIVSKEAEEAMLQHLADLWEPIEEVTRKNPSAYPDIWFPDMERIRAKYQNKGEK
jgi:hypothetical protein